MRYRGYMITYNPKPIPTRVWDYDFVHDDFDGPGDPRGGEAASIEDAQADIDELIKNGD